MNRKEYLSYLCKLADPVLQAPRLREIPVEQIVDRSRCTWMEAIGRLVCGIAPWLESAAKDPEEIVLQEQYRVLTRALIARQFDPASPDCIDFSVEEPQFLVDLAFLAEGMLRAPRELIEKQDPAILAAIIDIMQRSRGIRPYESNWLLFSAMVEALIQFVTSSCEEEPVRYAFSRILAWYQGDGIYGDGPALAIDYYNSYVIQPMLVELADHFPALLDAETRQKIQARAVRYAATLERMIAPDGSFVMVGRSIAYRCGAFHHLANMALRHELPDSLSPAAVREGIGAVIQRTLCDASFRKDGFLHIGMCSAQPSLGEPYISTGSLYLCAAAFLPLGLDPEDPFWTLPDADWTQKRLWSGADAPRDHSYQEESV